MLPAQGLLALGLVGGCDAAGKFWQPRIGRLATLTRNQSRVALVAPGSDKALELTHADAQTLRALPLTQFTPNRLAPRGTLVPVPWQFIVSIPPDMLSPPRAMLKRGHFNVGLTSSRLTASHGARPVRRGAGLDQHCSNPHVPY